MKCLFRRANIGALLDQLRRNADGKFLRQHKRVELEGLRHLIAGKAPRQNRDQIAFLLQLLLQWRQCLLRLRERCFLRRNIGSRDLAERQLLLQDGKRGGFLPDDVLRGCELLTQGCFLDRSGRQRRGEREVCRIDFEPLHVGGRLEAIPPRVGYRPRCRASSLPSAVPHKD